jgi:uncharacterized protein
MCHAFAEEKLWSHRVFVNFARSAASAGYAVLRFDFMGHGDSDGESEDCTIGSYITDLDAAIARLKAECPELENIALVGLRFGATLASIYANRRPDVSSIVLWEPVIDGHKYVQALLRINLTTQLAAYGKVRHDRTTLVREMRSGIPANIDGYLISTALYDEICDIDLLANIDTPLPTSCLVLQIALNLSQPDRSQLVDLSRRFSSGKFVKVHCPPFWRDIKPFCSQIDQLNIPTLDWLESIHV